MERIRNCRRSRGPSRGRTELLMTSTGYDGAGPLPQATGPPPSLPACGPPSSLLPCPVVFVGDGRLVGNPTGGNVRYRSNQFYKSMSFLGVIFCAFCVSGVFSQSSCPPYSFKCTNGQCIKETAVCDGAVDCRDRSDETHGTCSKLSIECPSFAFRCAYGACVDKNKTCDNIQDCADNSDELLAECKKEADLVPLSNVVCRRREFTCNSGHCIDETSVCDGATDCYDGSDETITQCINVRCPGFSFQCAYGACIDIDKKCNGVEDCKDGSDEDEELCEAKVKPTKKPITTTTTPPPKPRDGCRLPQKPLGGSYEVLNCTPQDKSPQCRGIPGTVVNYYTLIKFSCSDGFALPGQRDTPYCDRNGEWNPEPPVCKKLCPPLNSTDSVDVICHYEGQKVNCTGTVRPGTIAKATCKPAYQLQHLTDTRSEAECLPDGLWDETLITCEAECGVKNSVKTLISWAPETDSEYPWHAGLFKNNGADYFCGGTIISNRAILTAAHCVYDENKKTTISTDNFWVVVGKFHRSWDTVDPNEQRLKVLEIIIRDTYLGNNNRYEHDIAVLFLAAVIIIKPTVMPVCIDREHSYPVKKFSNGTVLGWGITESGDTSDTLRVAKLPFYDFHNCRDLVSPLFAHFISYDKFCAGLHNGTHTGQGDSGGGLTFPQVTSNNKEIHFLHGIVSVTDTYDYNITAFTNVTIHIPWFDRVVKAIKKSRRTTVINS